MVAETAQNLTTLRMLTMLTNALGVFSEERFIRGLRYLWDTFDWMYYLQML